MNLSSRQKTVIDVVQWILIAVLIACCIVVFIGKKNAIRERDIAKENAYTKIYQTQTIEELKKKNRELYDSITAISDKKPESAILVKYKYITRTDTVRHTEFVRGKDSVYHYVKDNDTIKTEIDIKAKELEWCKTNTEINDKFTVITRTGDNGTVETTIGHSSNVEIQQVDAWKRKPTFKERVTIGPTIGVGYGVFNKKFDMYIGVSVGIKLN